MSMSALTVEQHRFVLARSFGTSVRTICSTTVFFVLLAWHAMSTMITEEHFSKQTKGYFEVYIALIFATI